MEKNITLSLCMIVKDEEKTLARCLNSVKSFIDEIIIVRIRQKKLQKVLIHKYMILNG